MSTEEFLTYMSGSCNCLSVEILAKATLPSRAPIQDVVMWPGIPGPISAYFWDAKGILPQILVPEHLLSPRWVLGKPTHLYDFR